jgi:hypothetical protein
MALIDLGAAGISRKRAGRAQFGALPSAPSDKEEQEILPWDGDEVQYEDEEQDES